MTRRPTAEGGTVLVLVLGFAVLLVLMVGVVVYVSAVVLAKRAVASAADGAAGAAAQALDLDAVYDRGLGAQLPLSAAQSLDVEQLYQEGAGGALPLRLDEARDRVETYARQAAEQQPGLTLVVRVEGRTAVVTATRTLRLPFPVPGSTGSVRVDAVGRARAATSG